MQIKYTLPALMMRFSSDELFYIFITVLSFKGIQGFQTEEEGAQLVNKESSTIGNYRKKMEFYKICTRDLRYNKDKGRQSSYIIFKIKHDNVISMIYEYFKELQLFLNQEIEDTSICSHYKEKLELLTFYLNYEQDERIR